jgi:hypothetical protein
MSEEKMSTITSTRHTAEHCGFIEDVEFTHAWGLEQHKAKDGTGISPLLVFVANFQNSGRVWTLNLASSY